MIPNPTVNSHAVGDCPTINGANDCTREMIAASAVCKEYGFRKASSYHLQQTHSTGVLLALSIDNQEAVHLSEWMSDDLKFALDAIDCSK